MNKGLLYIGGGTYVFPSLSATVETGQEVIGARRGGKVQEAMDRLRSYDTPAAFEIDSSSNKWKNKRKRKPRKKRVKTYGKKK